MARNGLSSRTRQVHDRAGAWEGGWGIAETSDELLTPGEVARMFGVNPKTITRWAAAGKLNPVRTLGGHRRYRRREVESLLERAERPEGEPEREQ